MPEYLPLEFETLATGEANLEDIKDLLRKLVRGVASSAENMKGSAFTFENAWRRIVLDVAKGRTGEVQAARSRLLDAFEKRFGQLKHTQVLAAWLFTLGSDESIVHLPFPAPHGIGYATKADRDAVKRLLHWLLDLGLGSVDASVLLPENLLPEIQGMERLKARVFDQWHTAEDLETLAARDYPLTTADLDLVGPGRRPPASFYEEDNNRL